MKLRKIIFFVLCEKQKWILDSECSRHMSSKVSLFSEIKERCNGSITLSDKGKCKILGVGKVGKDPSKIIDNVYLIECLKFNLLSVSQLCNKGNHVIFYKEKCVVKNPNTGDTFITALRHDHVYALNTNQNCSSKFQVIKGYNG